MRIGRYDVVRELARGGMGVVYVARHAELGREVALKVLKTGGQLDPSLLLRFEAEAQTVAQLDHPNVVRVHDVGTEGPDPYLVMDLIDGVNLHDRLKQQGPLPLREAARISRTIAEALEHAHQRKIVHRDLKPANVLISSSGEPMVTDFGLAKDLEGGHGLTRDGQWVGTPGFMPPEQAKGELKRIDRRSDVYGIGGTLYAMLTGNPPFEATTAHETLKLIAERGPVAPSSVRPEVDEDLEAICLKCLEKEPEARYPTAQALAEDLGRYLDDLPVEARPASAGQRARKWLKRNRGLALSLGLAGAIVLGVSGGVLGMILLPERRAQTALADFAAFEEQVLLPYGCGLAAGSAPDAADLERRLTALEAAVTGSRLQPKLEEAASLGRATLRLLSAKADEQVPKVHRGRSLPDLVVDARLLLRRGEADQARGVLAALERERPRGAGLRLLRLLELEVQSVTDPHELLGAHPSDPELAAAAKALAPGAVFALFRGELESAAREGRALGDQRRLETAVKAGLELGLSEDEVAAAKQRALEATAPRWEKRLGLALDRGDERSVLDALSRVLAVGPRAGAGPQACAMAEQAVARLAAQAREARQSPRFVGLLRRLVSLDHRLTYGVDGRRHAASLLTQLAWQQPPSEELQDVLFRYRYGVAWALPRRGSRSGGWGASTRQAIERLQEERRRLSGRADSRLVALCEWSDGLDHLRAVPETAAHLEKFRQVLATPVDDVAPRYLIEALDDARRRSAADLSALSEDERRPVARVLVALAKEVGGLVAADPHQDAGSLATCLELEGSALGLAQGQEEKTARQAAIEQDLRARLAAAKDGGRFARHLLASFLFRRASDDPFSGLEPFREALGLWAQALPEGEGELEQLGLYLRCGIQAARTLREQQEADGAWALLQPLRAAMRASFRHLEHLSPMARGRALPTIDVTEELARCAWATGRQAEARAIVEGVLELEPGPYAARRLQAVLRELERGDAAPAEPPKTEDGDEGQKTSEPSDRDERRRRWREHRGSRGDRSGD
ncbi:MAG: protein kinase [Planctomycetota bacterium]